MAHRVLRAMLALVVAVGLALLLEAPAVATVVEPNTVVTITSSPGQVDAGGSVTLSISETNTSWTPDGRDWPLSNPYVELAPLGLTLTKGSARFTGGDINNDDMLNVGETWTWSVTGVIVTTETTFIATGHGTDPNDIDITYANGFFDEQAKVTVRVTAMGTATRTPGFWKTHLDFTSNVFSSYLNSDINIGWKDINNVPDLMGIFWANHAKNSDGSKRTQLCQAKEIAAFQAVAAVLNSGLPNGAPLPVPLTEIQAVLGGTDINAIKALGATLDAYNNSGDNVPINSTFPIGNANPKAAKQIANLEFADCP